VRRNGQIHKTLGNFLEDAAGALLRHKAQDDTEACTDLHPTSLRVNRSQSAHAAPMASGFALPRPGMNVVFSQTSRHLGERPVNLEYIKPSVSGGMSATPRSRDKILSSPRRRATATGRRHVQSTGYNQRREVPHVPAQVAGWKRDLEAPSRRDGGHHRIETN